MPFLPPNQQRQSTEGNCADTINNDNIGCGQSSRRAPCCRDTCGPTLRAPAFTTRKSRSHTSGTLADRINQAPRRRGTAAVHRPTISSVGKSTRSNDHRQYIDNTPTGRSITERGRAPSNSCAISDAPTYTPAPNNHPCRALDPSTGRCVP